MVSKSGLHGDEAPVKGLGTKDIDQDYFDTFLQRHFNTSLDASAIPLPALLENMNLMQQGTLNVAGALLLTPGFVTDGFGFLLLTPGVRSTIAKKWLSLMMKNSVSRGQSGTFYSQTTYRSSSEGGDEFRSADNEEVIEGEYREINASKKDIGSENKEK